MLKLRRDQPTPPCSASAKATARQAPPSAFSETDKGGIDTISFLSFPLSSCHSRESGNLRIYNILINFFIKHYFFNLCSICFYNFVLLDSRSLLVIPVPAYARINSGGNLSYSFVISALFLSFPRKRESKNLQYFN